MAGIRGRGEPVVVPGDFYWGRNTGGKPGKPGDGGSYDCSLPDLLLMERIAIHEVGRVRDGRKWVFP